LAGQYPELENLLVRACVVAKGQVLGVTDFPELGKEEPSKLPADSSADLFKSSEPGNF